MSQRRLSFSVAVAFCLLFGLPLQGATAPKDQNPLDKDPQYCVNNPSYKYPVTIATSGVSANALIGCDNDMSKDQCSKGEFVYAIAIRHVNPGGSSYYTFYLCNPSDFDALQKRIAADQKTTSDATAAARAVVESQSKNVSQYLILIPALAGHTTAVKNLTANYLLDNLSISSIPRNYRSLTNRHVLWLKNFVARVAANQPDFSKIVDMSSYQAAVQKSYDFADTCLNDQALSKAESRFASDVLSVMASMTKLQANGSKLKNRIIDPAILAVGSSNLAPQLDSANSALASYLSQLTNGRLWILAQQSKRALLCSDIPKQWRNLADAKLNQVNVGNADALIKQAQTAIDSPRIYAQVTATLQDLQTKINFHLNVLQEPIHARRDVFAAKAKVADLSKALAEATISPDMLKACQDAVAQFQLLLPTLETAANKQIQSLSTAASWRQHLVTLRLKRQLTPLTADCTALANTIVQDTNPTSADAEDSYEQFYNNCAQK